MGPQTYFFVIISPGPKRIIRRDTEQATRKIPTLFIVSLILSENP